MDNLRHSCASLLINNGANELFTKLTTAQNGIDSINTKLDGMDAKLDQILTNVTIKSTSNINTELLSKALVKASVDNYNANGSYFTDKEQVEWIIDYLVKQGYAVEQ